MHCACNIKHACLVTAARGYILLSHCLLCAPAVLGSKHMHKLEGVMNFLTAAFNLPSLDKSSLIGSCLLFNTAEPTQLVASCHSSSLMANRERLMPRFGCLATAVTNETVKELLIGTVLHTLLLQSVAAPGCLALQLPKRKVWVQQPPDNVP